MPQNQLTIRRSPFLFLKRLVFIEFFFALLPSTVAVLYNLFFDSLSDLYSPLPFARSVPFYLFTVVLVTSLQILIVSIAFLTWYVPVYVVDDQLITYRPGTIFADKQLAEVANMGDVLVTQGALAKRFDYGSLHLSDMAGQALANLSDIPEPARYAALLQSTAEDSRASPIMGQEQSAAQIVTRGEQQHVEFKSSLVWDYRLHRANKELHLPVMKTLAAFMNSSGGYLLIGVDDAGRVLGLEPDLQTMRAPTLDAFEISFNAAFNKMIGAEFRQYVELTFPQLEEKPVCLVKAHASPHPIYLSEKGAEKFYIRAGNASQSLTISQSNRYIQRRFQD